MRIIMSHFSRVSQYCKAQKKSLQGDDVGVLVGFVYFHHVAAEVIKVVLLLDIRNCLYLHLYWSY